MRIATLTLLTFLLLWLLLAAALTGIIDISPVLPRQLQALSPPSSTTELADSLAMLDGLFSSFAVVLGLIAIIFQGRELRDSTEAQTEQARALVTQIAQQEHSNRLAAYTARLQYLLAETDRLSADINRLIEEVRQTEDSTRRSDKQRILDNSIAARKRRRDECREIDQLVAELLARPTTGN